MQKNTFISKFIRNLIAAKFFIFTFSFPSIANEALLDTCNQQNAVKNCIKPNQPASAMIETPPTPAFSFNLDDLYLAKTFKDEKEKLEPASFTLTYPINSDIKPSYLINSAIGYSFSPFGENFSLIPNIEYNRNTLIEKEQHNLSAGLNFEWQIFPTEEKSGFWSPIWINNLDFNNDLKKQDVSFQLTPYFTFFVVKPPGANEEWWNFIFPLYKNNLGGLNILYTQYEIYSGFEFVGKQSVANNENIKALFSNLYFKFGFTIIPYDFLKEFELTFDYQCRYRFLGNDTNVAAPFSNLLSSGLNYTLFQDDRRKVQIGLDYSIGENPLKGLSFQENIIAALKVKL